MKAVDWRTCTLTWIKKTSLIYSLEIGIACVLSLFAGRELAALFHLSRAPIDALWCVISAILVIHLTWDNTFSSCLLHTVSIFIGSLLAAIFLSLLGLYWWVYLIILVFIVILFSLMSMLPQLKLALISVSIIFIINHLSPTSHYWTISLDRFLDALVGVVTTLIVIMIFKPMRNWLQQAGADLK